MVVAALGMTHLGLPSAEDEEKEESNLPRGQWFRVILVCIIALFTFGVMPRIESAIPGLGWQVIAGSLILMGAGVVHLGLTSEPLNVTIGLLTILTGFEILYAAIESSILVAGLLAVISLGLGIVGSYLLIAGSFPIEMEGKE
jgi:hypothetical protein